MTLNKEAAQRMLKEPDCPNPSYLRAICENTLPKYFLNKLTEYRTTLDNPEKNVVIDIINLVDAAYHDLAPGEHFGALSKALNINTNGAFKDTLDAVIQNLRQYQND